MNKEIIDRILEYAKEREQITVQATSRDLKISPQIVLKYLMQMTLDKLLTIEEQVKKNSIKNYTYRFWRIKK